MRTRKETLALLVAVAAAVTPAVVRAQYDSFFFSTNSTDYDCPGFPFECRYPFACSHDATVDKYYCCIPGSSSSVCWTGSTDCTGNNGTAGSNELDCSGYCCLENREICTQREGQFNICWATAANPLANVSNTRMNETYSSLAAASPSATELSFQLAQVTSSTSTAAASSTTTTSAPASSSSGTSAPISSSSDSKGSGLSGGAIAGIAIGAVLGVFLIIAAVIFFRRRQSRTTKPNNEPYRQPGPLEYYGNEAKQEQQHAYGTPQAALSSPQQKMHQYYQTQPVPLEMDAAARNRSELESSTHGGRSPAHELPADRGI